MYKCICGKIFAKKVNFGKHLTVHKNLFLNLDENDMGKNYMDERIIDDDENEENHIVDDDNDMMSEDGGFKSQEENIQMKNI